jgi:2-polyprenyl-3-methyl-5-hydroxy-6-metoxy-1,4-benzoquinol methylase
VNSPKAAGVVIAGLPVYACIKTHDKATEIFAGWGRRGLVLDVAAGSGAFALRLHGLGYTVEACDLYPDRFLAPDIPVRYADVSERLPYDEGHFDFVSCLEGVEHLEDQFAFIRECWRVLRPGGRLLLSTPNVLGLASRWRYFWTGFFPLATRPMNEHHKAPVHDHIHLLTYYELRYILRTTGFEVDGVTTDRIRKFGLLHAWAYPIVCFATLRALGRERDVRQRAANREIAAHMLSADLLLGRTLMVLARKPA